jgi:glyoxylase-like metal-dependent hydrolase (beta-lactamase superfamily II)/8-oxo-dGTP pyrophosphatase MutT (NUDIX family)
MGRSLYEQVLAAVRAMPPEKPPRPSASVVPWRRGRSGAVEVYWVRRSPQLRFMGGWHAFPGGGLSRADAAIDVAEAPRGASAATFTAAEPCGADAPEAPDLVPGLAACALRELFEETGLLLAEEVLAGGLDEAGERRLDAARRRLLAGAADFADLVAEQGWTLSASRLRFAGRWLTPKVAPMRFDNRFFLLEWDAARRPQPEIEGSELVHGEWIEPTAALGRWRRGEVIAAPPILYLLEVLAADGPDAGTGRLLDTRSACLGPFRRIEFRPGVTLLPLRTPTLPPATHTNAFLLGHRQAVLVDPATPFEDEIERLSGALAAAREQGLEILAVWLTHHHPDHVGAVEVVRRDLGVPVCAHPLAAGPLARQGISIDRELHDGDRVVLAGDPPLPVRVYHTPGHTRGHLCFYEENTGSLIAGDLVSALSTIVIDPPEGDMDDYLESLRRMAELAPSTLFPSHGPVVLAAVDKLEELRGHRLEREAQVLAAWRAGKRRAAEMVADIYPEVPASVHPVAARQVQAHLDRLEKLGALD